MIKVSVLYPRAPGSRFDHAYYRDVHMAEAVKRLGPAMASITAERGLNPGAPWPDAAFEAIAVFTCASLEAYAAAFAPHADWLQADIANYTDITPVIQISDLVLAEPAP